MRSTGRGALGALGFGLVVLALGACDKKDTDVGADNAAAGCQKDTDCKGDRVCADGKCVAAAPKGGPGAAPQPQAGNPAAPGGPGASPAVATPPSLTFTEVGASEWTPRFGPKMKPGSKMVHMVFKGPFGPSPQSLFGINQRSDDTFYVLVMGDDNRSWPAGPLAEPGTNKAHKITAVSFFDADGNGTTDALVLATYTSPTGGDPYNVNVLLKWTDQGMRRLLKLEPDIAKLASVAAVRAKLGR